MEPDLIQGEQYNIGYICTGRQCEAGREDKVALRWISSAGERSDYTFAELDAQSNRFSNVLQNLGLAEQEVLFTFLPRLPEQFFTFLGALKRKLIIGTLFSSFGDEALLDRLGNARAVGVVTRRSALRKLNRIRDRLPALRFIIVTDSDEHLAPDILSLKLLMGEASPHFVTPLTAPDTPSVLHYTSGSTGKPKGVLHIHRSVLHLQQTARQVLGLAEDDIYWCTADQGWVTGTSYGIIAPWSLGVTQVHYGGGYDAEAWFDILAGEGVNVWYTAPTVLRMLMREEPALPERYPLPRLHRIFSVGEPLNPEVIYWARRTLGKEIHDTWFQTETGGIMITNLPGLDVHPGSMGKPVAGVNAAILTDEGAPVPDGETGNLCLRAGWTSQFFTYLNSGEAYREKFRGGYYFSGDTAYRDKDGYFWFQGRSDDVINTAGHLISPFEIESAILEIEEVAESGVIGVPDELLFEKVVAFISLHRQYAPSRELELKIRLHVANRASSIATPQEVIFTGSVPKNKSGKIMRRVLKAGYLGTDAGDISTLENKNDDHP